MKKLSFRIFFLVWLPLFIWMGLIFFFSSMPGTGSNYYDLATYIERKGAHVFEYFVLSLLFFRFFKIFNVSTRKMLVGTVLLSLIFAVSDELHQLFVFGREGRIRDVLIDFIGIFLASLAIKKIKILHKI